MAAAISRCYESAAIDCSGDLEHIDILRQVATLTNTDGRAFETSEDVYLAIGEFLAELADAPGFRARLLSANCQIAFDLTDPSALICVELKRSSGPSVSFGGGTAGSDTVIRASSIALSDFLLGELDPFLAAIQGLMEVEGLAAPFFSLAPQVQRTVSPLYAMWLTTKGFESQMPADSVAAMRAGIEHLTSAEPRETNVDQTFVRAFVDQPDEEAAVSPRGAD